MSEEKEIAPVAPLVLVVSGPSGSGKSTLVQRILELPGTMASTSCTTRARRTTEASGKCYDFVTEAQFDAMVRRGEFLEYARVFPAPWASLRWSLLTLSPLTTRTISISRIPCSLWCGS